MCGLLLIFFQKSSVTDWTTKGIDAMMMALINEFSETLNNHPIPLSLNPRLFTEGHT